MTPEQDFAKNVLWVLDRIKKESLSALKDQPIEYSFTHVAGAGIPSKETEKKILEKLAEEQAIVFASPPTPYGSRFWRKLHILQPGFDETYDRFRAIYNPEPHAEKYDENPPLIKAIDTGTTDTSIVELGQPEAAQAKTTPTPIVDLISNLQRRYNHFFSLPNKGFFSGLADYVKYVLETAEFVPLLQSIKAQLDEDQKSIQELEQKLSQDITRVSSEISALITKEKIDFEGLKQALDEFHSVLDGRIQSSATIYESTYNALGRVIAVLFESKYKNLVEDLVEVDKGSGVIIDYKISEHYHSYEAELKHFRRLMLKTVWGSWNELEKVYLVTHQYRIDKSTLGQKNDYWHEFRKYQLYQEMENVQNATTIFTSRNFIKDDYVIYLNRVHDYFIEKLQSMAINSLSSNDRFEQTIEQKDIELEIKSWLINKDESVIQKMWQVVFVLNAAWQLRDMNTFQIPRRLFKGARIEQDEDLEAILVNLHRKKFIVVSSKVGETPPPDKPNVPSGSIWAPITDDPKIIYGSNTEVEILPQRFKQLVQALKGLNPQEVIESYNGSGGEDPVSHTQSKNNKVPERVESGETETDSIPGGWELVKDDSKGYLKKDGSVVFTFTTNWSRKFKYFEYLWDHYGEKTEYKVLYESCTNLDYPKRGEVWKVNKAIRNEINKLRKELHSHNLPICIETARGLTITIAI